MLFKSLKLLIEKTWEIKLRIDILLKKHPIHSIYSFWMIFVKILKILRFSTNIFGNFYLYFSMYNITLSYFFWLFWRSKEHLFRNFFSFQISSRTITWSLSLGARQVRMPRSIPIHFCILPSCFMLIDHLTYH